MGDHGIEPAAWLDGAWLDRRIGMVSDRDTQGSTDMKKLLLWAFLVAIGVSGFTYLNWNYLMTEEERAEVLASRAEREKALEKEKLAKQEAERLREQDKLKERRLSYAPIMCERFVKGSLKAPSTADFQPNYQMKVVPISDNEFVVGGYVDAENSFGAKIRSKFACHVLAIGDSWQLMDLKIQ